MTRTIYRDFDEFADAIKGISGRFVPTARSETDWWVQLVRLGSIDLQQLQIGGAAAFAGDGTHDAITLGIPVYISPRIRIEGEAIEDNSFILVKQGRPFTCSAQQPTRWMSINVPVDHALLTSELVESLNARSSAGKIGTHARTRLPHVATARKLISRLLAIDESGGFNSAAGARAAEEEIMAIASQALKESSRAEPRHSGRPRVPRGRVLGKALEVIEESRGQPLFLRELCRSTQVSERTLRNIFQEYFGVGPMRLLKVSQLREIRAALYAADPAETSVADIAGRFGIWDFSLFAYNYKALYEETPSETLRRPAVARRREAALDASWIRYVSRKFTDSAQGPKP